MEQRILELVPADALNAVDIPTNLTEIRAYVRWEEAGKPENTSREWQSREYQAALVDLKLELLSGGSLNEIRRRYNVECVDGQDGRVGSFDHSLVPAVRRAQAVAAEPGYYNNVVASVPMAVDVPEVIAAIDAAAAIDAPAPARPPADQRRSRAAVDLIEMDDLEARIAAAARASPLLEEMTLLEAAANAMAEEIADLTDIDRKAAAFGDAAFAEALKESASELAANSAVEDAEAELAAAKAALDAARAKREAAAGSLAEETAEEFDARIAAAAASLTTPPTADGKGNVPFQTAFDSTEDAINTRKAAIKADKAAKFEDDHAKLRAEAAARVERELEKGRGREELARAEDEAKATAMKRAAELKEAKAAAEAELRAAEAEMQAARAALAATAKSSDKAKMSAAAFNAAHDHPASSKADKKNVTDVELDNALPAALKGTDADITVKANVNEIKETSVKKLKAAEELRAAAKAKREAIPDEDEELNVLVSAIDAETDAKLLAMEEEHRREVEELQKGHDDLLAALKEATANENADDLVALRAELEDALDALESVTERNKDLKSKLAQARISLAKAKAQVESGAKAKEELVEAKTQSEADQFLIATLKKQLKSALAKEAAATERATAAEKEAAALAATAVVDGEEVETLKKELAEALDVVAEFKAAWEADRKVIALLSGKMTAEQAKSGVSPSEGFSANPVGSVLNWANQVVGVSAAAIKARTPPPSDAAADALNKSSRRLQDARAAARAQSDKETNYARMGGSATVARIRAGKDGAVGVGQVVDESTRERQMNWLAAAEEAAAEAAAEEAKAPTASPVVEKIVADVVADASAEEKEKEKTPEVVAYAPSSPAAVQVTDAKSNAVPSIKMPAAPATEDDGAKLVAAAAEGEKEVKKTPEAEDEPLF